MIISHIFSLIDKILGFLGSLLLIVLAIFVVMVLYKLFSPSPGNRSSKSGSNQKSSGTQNPTTTTRPSTTVSRSSTTTTQSTSSTTRTPTQSSRPSGTSPYVSRPSSTSTYAARTSGTSTSAVRTSSRTSTTSGSSGSSYQKSAPISQKLQQIQSSEDTASAKMSPEETKNLKKVQEEKIHTTRTYRKKGKTGSNSAQDTLTLDTSVLQNLDQVLEKTAVVYTNADLAANNIMNEHRFNYYCGLHFRSMIAADICYDKKAEIKVLYTKVKKLLEEHHDPSKPLKFDDADKESLENLNTFLSQTIRILGTRVDNLNRQTRILKDKIGTECGERGHAWKEKIEANKNK